MPEDELEAYDFGERLRELREGLGLSQAEAARKMNISKNSLYRCENNLQEPTRKILTRFALCYNTSIDYLAGLNDTVSIDVHNLSSEEIRILRDFVHCFVENRNG